MDVPGNVEVYVGTDDENEDVCEDQPSIRKSKRAKIVLKEIPNWKKSAPNRLYSQLITTIANLSWKN